LTDLREFIGGDLARGFGTLGGGRHSGDFRVRRSRNGYQLLCRERLPGGRGRVSGRGFAKERGLIRGLGREPDLFRGNRFGLGYRIWRRRRVQRIGDRCHI
jgi:hypothetical protein